MGVILSQNTLEAMPITNLIAPNVKPGIIPANRIQPQSRADALAAEKFAREQAMKIGTPLWLSFTTTALGSFLAGAVVASLMRL